MSQYAFNPPHCLPPSPMYSFGAAASGFVFTAGIVAIDDKGATQHVGDAKAQTRFVLDTVGQILEARGAKFDDVVMVQVYLNSMLDYAAMNEAYADVFQVHRPPRFCVAVGLVKEDWLVEIAVVAAVKDKGRP